MKIRSKDFLLIAINKKLEQTIKKNGNMMEIVIISGQPGVPLLNKYNEEVEKHKGCVNFYFPERIECLYHPQKQYTYTKSLL